MALSNMEQIAALNREARRRGTSYGTLIAQLGREEREEILRRYEREQKPGKSKTR